MRLRAPPRTRWPRRSRSCKPPSTPPFAEEAPVGIAPLRDAPYKRAHPHEPQPTGCGQSAPEGCSGGGGLRGSEQAFELLLEARQSAAAVDQLLIATSP